MKNEIIELLKKEGELSDENAEVNLPDFLFTLKEIGRKKTDYIQSSEISKNLNTTYIGKELFIYKEVSSTNTIAKFLSKDVENGSVIIAEKQTAGRGRSGKAWQSPLGGIWLSIVLNSEHDNAKIPFITLATGVAAAKAFEKIGIENAEIKWPNDILINDKKVCGILAESESRLNKIENVIVGVGIDANLDTSKLPDELKNITTSLEAELTRKVDVNHLIALFLEEFEKIIEIFNRKDYEFILKEWRKRSYSIGKNVEVRKPFNRSYNAYVLGISKEGALVVEKDDGTIEKVISGECIIKN